MDTSNPVLHGLLRKRQEIADKLEVAQSQVRQLVLDIDAVVSTIRLFHPDVEIGVVRIKPVARRHAAVRHESSRIVFGVLREAPGPMTTREIVRAVMEARGHEHCRSRHGAAHGVYAAQAQEPGQAGGGQAGREEPVMEAGIAPPLSVPIVGKLKLAGQLH